MENTRLRYNRAVGYAPTAMMLATRYRDADPTGWLMSEKLDGWRAFWDGYTLRTRTWLPIHAPASITALLPQGIALDGELWAGRGGLPTVQSLGQINRPADPRWAGVKYMVFDFPTTELLAIEERARIACKLAAGQQVGFVAQTVVKSATAMWARFRDVVAGGGEGLVIKRPGSYYEFNRCSDWQKVKPAGLD